MGQMMESTKVWPVFLLALVTFQASVAVLNPSKFRIPERFIGNNETVFAEFAELLKKYNPLTLGEGAPDYTPPEILQNALVEAATSKNYKLSQYPESFGHPRLLNATAKFYSKLFNQTLDPKENILITAGASEGLYAAIQTHTFPGDEWIIIEPYFEAYSRMVKAANGVPKFVSLKPQKTEGPPSSRGWTFDRSEMAKAFNKKTKGLILNTPHNPLGKVFTYEELSFIAELAKKWDVLVLSDEVYQFLVYDDNEHISIASLPGMFERTITTGTGGKMFSATGYGIGWAIGGAQIMNNLKFIQELVVECVPTPLQEAFAITFEKEAENFGNPDSYLSSYRKENEEKRNYLMQIFNEIGMQPIIPEGGYFVVADWTTLSDKINLEEESGAFMDYKFAKWMIKNVKVLGLPVSGFYNKDSEHVAENGIRFTLIKKFETLKEAGQRFLEWKSKQ